MKRIYERFLERYVEQPAGRLRYVEHFTRVEGDRNSRVVEATITDGGREVRIEGRGTGAIDGFMDALNRYLGLSLSVADYSEHSLQRGSNASAIAYMEIEHGEGRVFGAGIDQNATTASLKAIVSGANRVLEG